MDRQATQSPAPSIDDHHGKGVPMVVIFSLGVLLPLAALATGLVWLLSATGTGIAEHLGSAMLNQAVEGVRRDVRGYLTQAMAVSDLYARRVETGRLPVDNLQVWEDLALEDMLAHSDIASICFANLQGDTTWVLRAHGRMEVGAVDGPGGHRAIEHEIFADGRRGDMPLREYEYVASSRPWYSAAMQHDGPTWIPVYFWFGDGGLATESGTGYTRAISGPGGERAGALVIDVTLGALSDFLKRQRVAEHGRLIIVDGEGQIVAASAGPVISSENSRLSVVESSDAAARAIAVKLKDTDYSAAPAGDSSKAVATFSGIASLATGSSMPVEVDGEPWRAQMSALAPFPGIDWWVIALIPEAEFMSDAEAAQRRALFVSVGMIVVAAVLGLALSRRMTRPLLVLNDFVRRVGGGDFKAKINLKASRELTELSRALNEMAAGLRQRSELQQSLSIAMQVQRSLLPRSAPSIPGLDIAGRARYCDATGGDYYDFIEIAESPRAGLVIAVGDVMGHGVAAALLMATARAALRANAHRAGSLGDLMTTVNDVLARDAEHGRFVTMSLVVVDPKTHVVRWACAGHDPALQYMPEPDGPGGFATLDGGDLPLGVSENVIYEEYRAKDVPAGSILFIGTDGIWEARNPDGEMFGKSRLKNVIRAHANESAADLAEAIERSVRVFADTQPIMDDITFVVIKLLHPVSAATLDHVEPGAAKI